MLLPCVLLGLQQELQRAKLHGAKTDIVCCCRCFYCYCSCRCLCSCRCCWTRKLYFNVKIT